MEDAAIDISVSSKKNLVYVRFIQLDDSTLKIRGRQSEASDTGKAGLPDCGRYEDSYLGFCSELRLQGHFSDIVRLCGNDVFVILLWHHVHAVSCDS
jgi:hypothetical protein